MRKSVWVLLVLANGLLLGCGGDSSLPPPKVETPNAAAPPVGKDGTVQPINPEAAVPAGGAPAAN